MHPSASTGSAERSGPAISIMRSRSTAASFVALPDTNVWRDAEVLPASAVRSVSPATRSMAVTGVSSASAAIWVRIVFEPCPMSWAPLNRTYDPSGRRPIRMVDGFVSDVLPMPYHIAPMPMPRRIGLRSAAATWLWCRASSVPSTQAGRRASRQGANPALAASTWPVAVVDPARSALRSRISRRSMPSSAATSSTSASPAIAAWGTPKPRNAPEIGPFV